MDIVRSLLPPHGRILDLACGTGRLSLWLHERGYEVVGVDSSVEMLTVAREKPCAKAITWLQGDAFALPLASAAVDAVVALRFAFHLADLRALLGAVVGVLKPGGTIVLDTYNWSPRAIMPIARGTWGGRVYAHRSGDVAEQARKLGLRAVERRECFLFSPYLYRLLPLGIVRGLERLEPLVPGGLRARVFWRFQPATD